jgi:hypothetical protein
LLLGDGGIDVGLGGSYEAILLGHDIVRRARTTSRRDSLAEKVATALAVVA